MIGNENNPPQERRGTLSEVAKQFLRLGSIAYGGPAAHVAMMEEEFVRRRGWLTRERFLDLVGAISLLPGPSSTELAIYLGEIRAGLAGLLVAGAFLDGVNASAVALMVFVGWQFGRAALVNVPAVILATLSALMVFRYKVNSTCLVLGGAAAGIVLRLLGWS